MRLFPHRRQQPVARRVARAGVLSKQQKSAWEKAAEISNYKQQQQDRYKLK